MLSNIYFYYMKKLLSIISYSSIVLGVTLALYINTAVAYVFSSTGVTVEASDVSTVTTSAMNAVGTQFEVLKFLGLFLLVMAAGYILNKVLGIKIG